MSDSDNNILITTLKKICLLPEPRWSKLLGVPNQYHEPWPVTLSKKNVPEFDSEAFEKYYDHNFVYDKLWIAESQGIMCGKLETLVKNPQKYLEYPIFIKPRWGHKSASSKNCYKIDSYEELRTYSHLEEMIWTEFIDDREEMTDFFVHNGRIVYYITYKYSKTQNGVVADEWKYVSNATKPPSNIVEWVTSNMKGFSGICNAQYRGTKIIEISLRLGRGGAYIYSTDLPGLVENINELVIHNKWDYTKAEKFKFRPYYAFKCFTTVPLIYIPPHFMLENIMKNNNCKEFYEYYFEPSGKDGLAFYQFLNEDFETGMIVKEQIETMTNRMNYFFYLMILLIILLLLLCNNSMTHKLIIFVVILYMTRFLNSGYSMVGLINAQKQAVFG